MAKRRRDPVRFSVQVDFDYEIEPLDDDPENPLLLADLERQEIYNQVINFLNIDTSTIKISINPVE